MTTATYVFEVDWNNNGSYADANENITADVLSFECFRGRDYASQLTGRASAGTLQATLNNTSQTYSPANTTGPLYGNLVPGRSVRVRTTAPNAATLWTGFLDRIEPATSRMQATATLRASGSFVKLVNNRVYPAASAGALTGTILGAILDEASWPALNRTLDAGKTTTGRWYVADKSALEACREIEDTEMGFFYEGVDGYLTFEDRHHRLKNDHLTSQATFSDAAGATLPYLDIQESDPLREIYNIAEAIVQTYSVAGGASVLWSVQTGETITLAPGETKTYWATYPNAVYGATNGAYVSSWSTPVVGTDVTQTGVANGDIGIATSKMGATMKIAITNNNASATATLTLVQAQGIPVTFNAPTRVMSEDATSETAYGKRPYNIPAKWLASGADAADYANYVVSRYKDPLAVLSLTLAANRDASMMAQCLTRALSDRVTVVAQNKAKLGINSDFFIESIRHQVSGGPLHITTFELSAVGGDGSYWVLGTSQLGTGTKLGY